MSIFDFNGDGKVDFEDHFLEYGVYQMMTEMSRDSNSESSDTDEWREFCEDGSEYGLDPEDYDTEEEYMEALYEEKYGWREFCEDGSEYDIDPEDYETEDEYLDALKDAMCE